MKTGLTLLFWNISGGGGKRVERLVSAIFAHDPDLIALCEYRHENGQRIRALLRDLGWRTYESTNPGNKVNSIAVFSRIAVQRNVPVSPNIFGLRWLEVGLPESGINVVVLHIPGSSDKNGRAGKAAFWKATLERASELLPTPTILIGDFNTGLPYIDEKDKTFACWEQFQELVTLGYNDLWRAFNSGSTEFTWYSNKGNGFRLDHAFCSPSLLPCVRACYYSHTEREGGTSDHSSILLKLDLDDLVNSPSDARKNQ